MASFYTGSSVRKTDKRILFQLVLLIILLSLTASAGAEEESLPFHPGEKLTFQLSWSFIPAGEAELKVLPIEIIHGEPSYHFVLTVKSNSFFDTFYKVRDRIDAYTDIHMTHSVYYKKKQQEGRHKRDIFVAFDWKKSEAQYSNFGKKLKPIALIPGTFDPLSIFYYSRLFNPQKTHLIKRPVTDGKKCIIGVGRIIRRETISLKTGKYDAYLIEPEMKHIGGVFKKSKNAKIKLWITADKRRIPIKIKSKVTVGSFIGELIDASGI